jgi:hypothetical protein
MYRRYKIGLTGKEETPSESLPDRKETMCKGWMLKKGQSGTGKPQSIFCLGKKVMAGDKAGQ